MSSVDSVAYIQSVEHSRVVYTLVHGDGFRVLCVWAAIEKY